jgi:group II intron reverse transcriptase/maturase
VGLAGVREAAKRKKDARFTALLHHVDPNLLRDSFYALQRQAAPGVDGLTWQEYECGLEGRLAALHEAVHRGSYRAQPSRRVFIPKADGTKRPLGIAALEDKIVQQALVTVLNAVYEADFLGFSYGFRAGRGQHDALDALTVGLASRKVNWVLDADIQKFFDTLDHAWLVRFVEHRIADPRVLRLIRRWLGAGVVEEGVRSRTKVGTPQGAVVSPLLANIYLHYVFDLWVHRWRKQHARGDMIVVRYADDTVVGFERREEAEAFLAALQDRLQKFGLALHGDKTRLIEFGRFAADHRARRGESKPETFDFLGFTHICGRAKNGRFIVRRLTVAKRLRATLHAIRDALMRRRHGPVDEVGRWLQRIVRGYFNYHAVSGNLDRLQGFRSAVARHWLHALRRRSQRRRMPWARFRRWVNRWLPYPRLVHPSPFKRFDATHPT